jgi:steroid delta-isomerase-like uncharacterized protein
MLEQVKRALAAYDAGDWDAYRKELAPDAIYDEAATGMRVKGADGYLSAIKSWKRAFTDLKANIVHAFVSGNAVILEVQWVGTHDGPLAGPFGTIPPTGKRGSVRAMIVFLVENDRIVECRHFFDLLTMLQQMGIAPSMGAPARKDEPGPRVRH